MQIVGALFRVSIAKCILLNRFGTFRIRNSDNSKFRYVQRTKRMIIQQTTSSCTRKSLDKICTKVSGKVDNCTLAYQQLLVQTPAGLRKTQKRRQKILIEKYQNQNSRRIFFRLEKKCQIRPFDFFKLFCYYKFNDRCFGLFKYTGYTSIN